MSDGRVPAALLWALRAGFAAVLLWIAIRLAVPADGPPLATAVASSWTSPLPVALLWFAAGSAAYGAAVLAGALRFLLLLRGAGLTSGWRPVLRAYVVANFLGMALPSGVVGDAYRFVDARRDSGRGAEVVGVLVLERLLGVAALCSVALVAVPFVPAGATGAPVARALIGVSAVVFVAAATALHPRGQAWLKAAVPVVSRLSTRLAGWAGRALDAVSTVSRDLRRLASTFGLSLLCQWLPVCGVYALAQPLDSDLAIWWYPVVVPFVMAMSLLPISVGGAGVRESLFIALFGAAGMRGEVALALSLSVVAANLVWGLVGLVLFAVGRKEGRA